MSFFSGMFGAGSAGGPILGGVAAVVVGGGLAVASVTGLVTSQTSAPDRSPADVSKPAVIDYGTTTG